MSKVYISSTYDDLRPCRERVDRTLRQLGHAVVAMEDYVASDERPLERCIEDVASSDLYIGIVAWRYGFVPAIGNPEKRSITELEYIAAERAHVPRLMFLLADDAAWPVRSVDTGTGRGHVERFRDEVKEAHMVTFFRNCDELASSVAVAVQQSRQEEVVELERATYLQEHSWLDSLIKAVRIEPQNRKAALFEWAEHYGPSVAGHFGKGLANRYRRRIAEGRDRERQQRLEIAVQRAVRNALDDASTRPERGA